MMQFKKLAKLSLIFFAFLLFFVFAASTPSFLWAKEDVYRIGRTDLIEISVWQSPDLTKTIAVDSDGTITYPILGKIEAAGQTPEQLRETIRAKLAEGYVRDPQVDVSIKEFNSKQILVFGEVGQPGLYKIKGPISVLELLFMVGGGNTDAKRMTIIRRNEIGVDAIPTALSQNKNEGQSADEAVAIEIDLLALLSKGDLSQNVVILPGDTLYVSTGTGQRYYVLGQVNNPGPIEWSQEITVLEAIKNAGGATSRAALNRIQMRENKAGKQQVLKINVVDIMKGKKKDDTVVRAGDVIVVPESWI